MSGMLGSDPNLAACLAFVRSQEGGWADVKGDKGGATQAGVTLATFRAWRQNPLATADELRALSGDEWDAIMVAGYYHPCRCQDLPAGVGLQTFDMAVNAGVRASVHILQTTLGVTVDGVVGPETISAARAAGRGLINGLNTAQAAYYRSLDDFAQFGHGWLARDAQRAAAAMAAFEAVPVVETVGVPHEQAVAQALDAWRAHPLNDAKTLPAPAAPPAASELPQAPLGSTESAPRRVVAVGPPEEPAEASVPRKTEEPMADYLNFATGAMKGAAAGAALGPLGMAGGAALGLAVQLVPQLSRWIGGDNGEATAARVIGLVQDATGSGDAKAQAAAVQDPQVSSALAVQLAQVVSEREAAADTAQVERLKDSIADIAGARAMNMTMMGSGKWMGYAPAILSLVILVSFGVMIWVVLTRNLAGVDNTLSSILLGTLAAMATQVANFYLGSSAGSQRKDAYLAQSFPAAMFPKPSALVPAADLRKDTD